MDFFKSVFSDQDPASAAPASASASSAPVDDGSPSAASATGAGPGSWGFGGLIKNLASRSETVLQTYRRDLDEFRSGLFQETETLRDVAARAVRELPVSIEAGAAAAQTVGHAVADIVSHGKEKLLDAVADPEPPPEKSASDSEQLARRLTRFETQVLALQSDPATFTSDPDDLEEFERWKEGFKLAGMEEEIEMLCYDSDALEQMIEKLVPDTVDHATFWCRYFFRIHKLKQAEDKRAKLVKRVISMDEEEEDLSWEVDDDDDSDKEPPKLVALDSRREVIVAQGEVQHVAAVEREIDAEDRRQKAHQVVEEGTQSVKEVSEEAVVLVDDVDAAMPAEGEKDAEVYERMDFDRSDTATAEKEGLSEVSKVGSSESSVREAAKSAVHDSELNDTEEKAPKIDGNHSVAAAVHPAPTEDDLEWDEIEDLGEGDSKKVGFSSSSSPKVDLRKRLSAAEEDEDLTWDIEDDDDDAKP